MFHDRLLLGRCFCGLVLPVLEKRSAVWCSAADTHFKILDRVVSRDHFLTGGVIECDITHRRSVAILCMLYKIRCHPIHPLYGALPVPHVPAWATGGVLVAHQYTTIHITLLAAEPLSTTGFLFSSQYSLTLYSMVWDWHF